jgi:glucose-6-phosphate isomerase
MEISMIDAPYSFDISSPDGRPSRVSRRIERRLSSMRGQYADHDAYEAALRAGDVVLYEVFELERPAVAGEVRHGVSVVHPGKIGDEYFMTKGHFHAVLETAELYHCLAGKGFMVMETPEGDWSVEPMSPGVVVYIPPRWGHRSVNTGRDADLIMFFGYPGNAGHDYGSIERNGFRKLVIERDGEPVIVDNPRWVNPGAR